MRIQFILIVLHYVRKVKGQFRARKNQYITDGTLYIRNTYKVIHILHVKHTHINVRL